MTDAEVDRRVQLRIVELVDDVRTHNTELRRTVRDEGRDIEGADADQRDVRLVCREHERAALLVEEVGGRLDAHTGEQRQRLVEDASLGDGKDDRFGHKRGRT